mmetsp:Transcript_50654/g.110868  ORF Transcript_50654/g.110868 Transcript_50654/m.110868 type:complete len:228 (-) Transcript_50654:905-1588(-)
MLLAHPSGASIAAPSRHHYRRHGFREVRCHGRRLSVQKPTLRYPQLSAHLVYPQAKSNVNRRLPELAVLLWKTAPYCVQLRLLQPLDLDKRETESSPLLHPIITLQQNVKAPNSTAGHHSSSIRCDPSAENVERAIQVTELPGWKHVKFQRQSNLDHKIPVAPIKHPNVVQPILVHGEHNTRPQAVRHLVQQRGVASYSGTARSVLKKSAQTTGQSRSQLLLLDQRV